MTDRKGFVLVLVLIIAASLSIMVSAFSLASFYRNQTALKQINTLKAYYLASAGINYAILWNSNFGPGTPPSFSLTGKGDTITIRPVESLDSSVTRRSCTAQFGGATRTVEVEEDRSAPISVSKYVIKWK